MNLISKCFPAAMALTVIAGLTACSGDDWKDVDGKAPSLTLTQIHERTEAGRTIRVSGEITDADGISTIDLVCSELKLKKRIDLIEIYGEPQTSYQLDYEFKIQENETGDNFVIDVITTDVGGRQDKQQVTVTLDGDFNAPVFTAAPDNEITVILKPQTYFNLQFAVSDNRVVDYAEIDLVDITNGEENAPAISGFPRRIEGNGTTTLEFSDRIDLPNKTATLKATITAYDKEANEEAHATKINSIIKVSELPDFPTIWLCDVATAADLNSDVFGVPVAMDHVGEYKYSVRYYNEKAGTEICFLAQKTDFGPICFGPDPNDNNTLGDDPDEVGRIKLNQAGVYYKIDVNTKTRTYALNTYSVAEAVNPVSHLHYGQNDLNTWWETDPAKDGDIWWQEWWFGPTGGPNGDNPDAVPHMTQDSANPNIFVLEDWSLESGEEMNFILHNWHSHGWWNFTAWRVDDSADPSKFMYYGNYIPATSHYASDEDYFNYKYVDMDADEFNFMYPNAGGSFDLSKWGDEGYRKNFVPDNWAKPTVVKGGKYKFIFDAHAERARLVPQN